MSVRDALKWDEKSKGFRYRNKMIPGLHPTLSLAFYPVYSYERAKLGQSTEAVDMKGGSGAGSGPPQRFKKKFDKGKELGSRIDKELQRVVSLMDTCNLTLGHFKMEHADPYPAEMAKLPQLVYRVESFKRDMHPYTANLLQVMRLRKWEPERAQLPVMDEGTKTATAIDVLCRNTQTDRKVVVEVKCGFVGYYDKFTAYPMNKPFDDMTDCPRNQHQLQLAFTRMMYCKTFGKRSEDVQAFIMRVHPKGVSVYPLRADVVSRLPDAQLAILEERNESSSTWVSEEKRKFTGARVVYKLPETRTPATRLKAKTKPENVDKERVVYREERKKKQE